MITDAAGCVTRRYCSTKDQPSMIGMRRSQRITAGWSCFISSSAAAPWGTVATA